VEVCGGCAKGCVKGVCRCVEVVWRGVCGGVWRLCEGCVEEMGSWVGSVEGVEGVWRACEEVWRVCVGCVERE